MCGILGAMFFPIEKRVKNRLWAVQRILAEAFDESKDRGKDASGVAMIAGEYYTVVKGPWTSDEFMSKKKDNAIVSSVLEHEVDVPFDAFNKICREKEKDLSLIMMHTRAKTQGSEYENKNNHPILVPNEDNKDADIIGVHNGIIRNDTLIRKKLRSEEGLVTNAEVDSASLFEVIYNSLGNKEPTLELMDEIAKWIDGHMAVCAVSRHHPHKVMFWRDSRPLEYLISKDLGIIFFASDDKYVKEAIIRYNRGKLLFSERLSLPSVDFESKMHTDDWSVLFDTSKALGTVSTKKIGIGEFAEEKRTSKQIYTDLEVSVWTGNRETELERTKRYIKTVSNTIEKEPSVDRESNIDDLSPNRQEDTAQQEDYSDLRKSKSSITDTTHYIKPELEKGILFKSTLCNKNVDFSGTTIDSQIVNCEECLNIFRSREIIKQDTENKPTDNVNSSEGDDEIIEGEIIEGHPWVAKVSAEEEILHGVTDDVIEASEEELERSKENDSIISTLEDVIDSCISESQLDKYANSLDAIKDMFDQIFKLAFVEGVAWRERMHEEEKPLELEELKNEHAKLVERHKSLEENRDELKKLLDKEMKVPRSNPRSFLA